MPPITLINVDAITKGEVREALSIAISDGVIDAIGDNVGVAGDGVDCSSLTVLPGFIDVHIHGAMGVDVNAADTDGLIEIATFLARNGVTAWMPTLVPDSDENYRRVIAAVDRLMSVQVGMPIAQAVGVHYEGVFANEKMCGALRPAFFKKFTGSELSDLPRLSSGVHMTTYAPEADGGIELTRALTQAGWIASIGHTRASVEVLDQAFAAGARHLTHFYNAMTGMHHRDVGVVGWALTNGDVTFDMIADGVHVHPRMLEFACRSKSPELVTLISDSIAAAGMGDGEFEIWDEKIRVVDGRTQNERGSIAGSVITMLDAVNQMTELGFAAEEVGRMASTNPARLIGVQDTRGSIEVGKRADIVAIDRDGRIRLTIIGGDIAFTDMS